MYIFRSEGPQTSEAEANPIVELFAEVRLQAFICQTI